MPTSTATLSETYRASAFRVGKLHALLRRGEGDSQEADDLRDELDEYWPRLTDRESRRIRGLSADLNMLDRPAQRSDNAEECDRFNEKFLPAQTDQDWELALVLIRSNPTVLTRHASAFLKGIFWARLGDLESALTMFEEAVRLEPTAPESAIALLETLADLNRIDEAARRAINIFDEHKDVLPENIALLARNHLDAKQKFIESTQTMNKALTGLFEAERALLQAVREIQGDRSLFGDGERSGADGLAIFAA